MVRDRTTVLRPSAGARPGGRGHGVLRADARFARLPRPDYDLDALGVRPGAAATLGITGSLLLAAAPFGAWLRVTRVAAEDAPAEIVQEITALGLGGGWWLLAVAGLTLLSVSVRRLSRRRWVTPALVTAAAVVVAALLLRLQSRIEQVAQDAVSQVGFHDLLAGVGWGTWAALLGLATVVLAGALGALSRPDVEEARA